MPRKYSMERRSASLEETRNRIIDATVQLHDEKGVSATSMQDIAGRAGVALGTVYRHFPTLDELIPACGGRIMELDPPPTAKVFADGETALERFEALIVALYAHYASSERRYEVGLAEALTLPVLQRFMLELLAYTRGLVTEAIEPALPDADQVRLAVAMADFRTWQAFKAAGFTSADAARIAVEIVEALLSAPSPIVAKEGAG